MRAINEGPAPRAGPGVPVPHRSADLACIAPCGAMLRDMHSTHELVTATRDGLYCPAGDFHIDPWRPVPRAVITHGHGDHARAGNGVYHCLEEGVAILRWRLGQDLPLQAHAVGEAFELGRCRVSLHPAGHVLGSAQVRIECDDQAWVVTGDYKRDPDPTCAPFEVVPCDTLITECTFGLPVYRWRPTSQVAADILDWWDACAARGQTAVLFCYALGKAQRVLAELARITDRRVLLHGAMLPGVAIYRAAGVVMLPTAGVLEQEKGTDFAGQLVLAPPSAGGSTWMRRFRNVSTGFASGWMRIRGNRRRRGHDRGFVLSDHADWPSLLRTIEDSGARRVLAMHGNSEPLVRLLRERGIDAATLHTPQGTDIAATAPALRGTDDASAPTASALHGSTDNRSPVGARHAGDRPGESTSNTSESPGPDPHRGRAGDDTP